MKRSLLLPTVLLLALAAPWRLALRSAAASSPSQVTMTLTAVWTGKWARTTGFAAKDEVSIHLTETCVYDITDWTDRNINLEENNCTTNLSAGGGGGTSYPETKFGPIGTFKNVSWSYSAQNPKSRVTKLGLDPISKTGSIDLRCCSESQIQATASGGQSGGNPGGMAVGMAFAATRPDVQRSSGGAQLAEAMKFKFDPNNSSFAGGNQASYSYSDNAKDGVAAGTFTMSYTVNGGAPKAETEVEIVPPKEYEQWLPQAGDDEKTIGNYIEAQIVAHKKDDPDSPPPKQVLKYTVTLQKTSREKGVDLNWPPKGQAKDDYDLKLDATNPLLKITGDTDQAQSAETTQEDLEAFIVRINCYDWGGYTNLAVTAELSDHTTVTAHVRGNRQQSLAIPKDDDGNHIADSWEESFGLQAGDPASDEDSQPAGHGHNGDSIALYDEYRGFRIQGKPQRLSPVTKDLFIWDASALGAGLYQASTGVTPHLIAETERGYGGSQKNTDIVTPNGHYGDVCAIWLHSGSIGAGVVGETEGGPSVPSNILWVTIDSNEIVVQYHALEPELQTTIAHELGHATNVHHHGEDLDYDVGDVVCHRDIRSCAQGDMDCVHKQGTVKNLKCTDRSPDDPLGKPGTQCFQVAAKGGSFSGNDTCPMRYDKTCFYEDPRGICTAKHNGRTVTLSFFGQDPPGMGKLCTDSKGTGVNDTSKLPNKAGDATIGNCASQVCLKNGAH
ncbi:exported hypothetical protein [Candidatus Sulfopaludibacter sp. SbA3]|nr:exported hypothetical protein [Candidatus Sulfopaludibacter sp. SbA3]